MTTSLPGAPAAPPIDERMGGWTGVAFDALEIGRAYPPRPLRIDAEDLRRFHACLGRTDVASRRLPTFLLNEIHAFKSWIRTPPGVLHARESVVQHRAAMVGEQLEVVVRIADKYVHNGKRFVVIEQQVRRAADGAAVLDVHRTLYWPC